MVLCTLYDRKNLTNSYNFLIIKRVNALDSSVSSKPIFIDFTLLIDMLPLLQFSIAMVVIVVVAFTTNNNCIEQNRVKILTNRVSMNGRFHPSVSKYQLFDGI